MFLPHQQWRSRDCGTRRRFQVAFGGQRRREVAEALAEQGIAAFVLKYRLHPTPESLDDFTAWMNRPRPATASSDTPQGATPPSPPQQDLSNQLEAAYAMILQRARSGVSTLTE
jgi:hypothetical protein